jgi:hypothetical protein
MANNKISKIKNEGPEPAKEEEENWYDFLTLEGRTKRMKSLAEKERQEREKKRKEKEDNK